MFKKFSNLGYHQFVDKTSPFSINFQWCHFNKKKTQVELNFTTIRLLVLVVAAALLT
jgi:hypothetical protein